jgi:excisionase family DNA binding protein
MTTKEQRGSVDAAALVVPEAEAMQIEELHRLLKQGNATLTSPDGLHQVELPDLLYRLLLRIMGDVLEGRPIAYTPATQDLTTQQTANLLGMSRQFLVGLLDKGELPYHRVGTHRRVRLKDAMAYRKQRDQKRHAAVNQMAKDAVESGHYDEF